MRTPVLILTLFISVSLLAAGHDLPSSQAQVWPAVTATGSGFMAAWVASGPNGDSVEWRAVNVNGEAIGGAGTAPEKTSYSSIAIAHSPSDAIVVWIADHNIHVQHLSLSGTALSTSAISSGERPRDVAVAWNGSRYFVVWATESRVLSALVAPEGTAAPPVLLNQPFFTEGSLERSPIAPDVAWDGRNFIVVFAEVNNLVCTQLCPGQLPDQHRVMRVSADGKPVDPSPIVIKGSYVRAHVASSGAESLITFDRDYQVSTIVVHDAGSLTLDAETPLFHWASSMSSAVVWDGATYTVGWRYRAPDPGPSWIGAARVTRSGLAFDYRVVATGLPIYSSGLLSWGPSIAVSDAGVTAFVISEGTVQNRRARLYLASEFAPMPAPPPAPSNVISYFSGETARIAWQLSDTAAGYVIETQVDIGRWDINAVVPAYLNTATVYTRIGNLLRVCAFGPGGVSEGTTTSIGSMPRRHPARH